MTRGGKSGLENIQGAIVKAEIVFPNFSFKFAGFRFILSD